ncbi:hypothetical protein WN944_028532 [Citrus x changshan-huyou]|uniref:Uncharacterized protein n=1 Tax=Citrus x changshan-huyou TaxID=2935761 RepID=A0AAP0LMW3_9ROSI
MIDVVVRRGRVLELLHALAQCHCSCHEWQHMDGAFEGEETKLGLRVQWHNYAAIACDEEWSGVLLQNGVVDMFSLLRFVNFVKIF